MPRNPTKTPSAVSSLCSKEYLRMCCLSISMATEIALIMGCVPGSESLCECHSLTVIKCLLRFLNECGCACLVSVAAKNSRITPSIKVTKGETTKCIDDFREGIINVIVATSVIEEVSQCVVSLINSLGKFASLIFNTGI